MADGRATLRDLFAIARDPRLSADEKLLWILYRSYDSGDGAWPGDDVLAGHVGKKVRTVKGCRARLVKLGYLTKESRGPKPAVFRAHYPLKGVPELAPEETHSGAARCTAVPKEGQRAVQEAVQPIAPLPHTPSVDESGSTGVRDAPPGGAAQETDAAEQSASADTRSLMTAHELVAAWIDRRGERPPSRDIARQGAVAKRLVAHYSRAELERAVDGIGRLYPHSAGEPWDLFDLERKAAKAMVAPIERRTDLRGGHPAGIDMEDLKAWRKTS